MHNVMVLFVFSLSLRRDTVLLTIVLSSKFVLILDEEKRCAGRDRIVPLHYHCNICLAYYDVLNFLQSAQSDECS
jgi:hypothetical protein